MRILPIVCSLAILGCATTGTQIAPEAFGRFKVGETTTEQALAVMGRPSMTSQNGDMTVYGWMWVHATAFGGAQVESVRLTFGPDGKLQNKTTSTVNHRGNHGQEAGADDSSRDPRLRQPAPGQVWR